MHRERELPIVRSDTPIKEALFEITDKRLGVTGVVDEDEKLVGIITDGDVRRGLQTHGTAIFSKTAHEVMTTSPRTISKDALASEALARMEQNTPRPITSLFVLDTDSEEPIGIIHLHDIFKAGL
jgi:arabinose-5-phosphate isomerase